MARQARIERETNETKIQARVDLDGRGTHDIATGVGFLDHMLVQLARHGMIDISLACEGDLEIDDHHTTEDCGIVLGQAVRAALGDRAGIVRYAHAYLPMDEALTRVSIDVSGRPFQVWDVTFPTAKVGTFDTEQFREWFQAFAMNAGVTLHVTNLTGANAHHIAESCYKGLARCLRAAVAIDPALEGRIPSSKGSLDG